MYEINPGILGENPFKIIGEDWMLVTAGTIEAYNTMTASWGGMGVLWDKNVVFVFVRPQRYTYRFAEKSDYFTLSFFEEEYRKVLRFCGTHSGRDVDKIEKTGLIPFTTGRGGVAFRQARLVMECRKLYAGNLLPGDFLDTALEKKIYPQKDHHRLYIAEITSCLMM